MSIEKRTDNSNNRFSILNVISISVSHHIHDIFTAFLAALQPTIVATFGLNNRLFGLLSVIQRIPTLLNPFIGILAEKVRIRYLMIMAPTLTAVSMSLMGLMPNYLYLSVLIFISGFSSALFHVPTPVMMRHVSGKKPGLGMGFYMFGGEFARTVGPVVALGAVDLWGFDGMFRLIPAGVVSSLLLFIRFRKVDLRKEFNKNKKDEGSYIEVFKNYSFLLIMITSVTLVTGGMKSIFTYYLVGYLEGIGWGTWQAGLGLSTVYLSGTIGSFIAGMVSDIIGKRTTLILSAFIAPTLVLFFIFSPATQFSFTLLALIGFFLLAHTPVFLSVVNSIKSKHVTFLNGIYMTINFLMSATATMMAGFGLDFIGTEATLKIAAFIALLAIPIVIFIPIKNKQ
ncbi:MAG: MFS transporter [Bacteroidales bacterium]|nr:MFS transporter [Bacteroidales bacterium]MBN2820632.1 MFS transporter [Bacteroidales bacterium]